MKVKEEEGRLGQSEERKRRHSQKSERGQGHRVEPGLMKITNVVSGQSSALHQRGRGEDSKKEERTYTLSTPSRTSTSSTSRSGRPS